MSELRAGAEVHGTDGRFGTVDAVVVDPTTATVTHLVVAEQHLGPRFMVELDAVTESSPELVHLALDREGIEACPHFDEPAYVAGDVPLGITGTELDPGSYFMAPYAAPVDPMLLVEHERIPKGEVTFRRNDEVRSSDGTRLGHIDEFLVDPADGHITHVVVREPHLLRRDDDVVVPIGAATQFAEGVVTLDLDVSAVHELPRIAVRRHRHLEDPT
jgi:sporulation protein YlmC with PRC-barrel domain